MLERIVRWFRGYLLVELRNGSPERFVNMCRRRGIYVWEIMNSEGICSFYIPVKDYYGINKIAVKCRTFPRIKRRTGFPFVMRAVFDMRTLLPCFVLFVITLFGLSGLVWSVNISGQHRYTKEQITEYLETLGVKKMMWKRNLDADAVERRMRNDYKDIGWVSVSLEGTDVYVKILESDMPDISDGNDIYSNIVASNNGVVERMITRTGTPLVKAGDKVKKGQVLVSGIVELCDDSGEVYMKKPVAADADIILKVKKKYRDEFPVIYDDRRYTGRNKTDWALLFGGKCFFVENILNKFENYEKYDIITEYIYDGALCIKKMSEYEIVGSTYTNEEAIGIASDKLRAYLEELVDKGIMITDKNITAYIRDGVCKSYGWLDILVPQNERSIITEKDWGVVKEDEHGGKDG